MCPGTEQERKVSTEWTFSLLFCCFHKSRENKTLKWSNIILSNIIVLYFNKSSNIIIILQKYCSSMKYFLKHTHIAIKVIFMKFSKTECIALIISLEQIRAQKMLLTGLSRRCSQNLIAESADMKSLILGHSHHPHWTLGKPCKDQEHCVLAAWLHHPNFLIVFHVLLLLCPILSNAQPVMRAFSGGSMKVIVQGCSRKDCQGLAFPVL